VNKQITAIGQRVGLSKVQSGWEADWQRVSHWLGVGLQYLLDWKRCPLQLPWAKTWRAWRLGFTPWTYVLYDLEQNCPDHFLSERDQCLRGHRLNGHYDLALHNKTIVAGLLKAWGIGQPEYLGRSHLGRFYGPALSLEQLLEDYPETVFRPATGCGGQGILIVQRDRVNDVPCSRQELLALLSTLEDLVVTRFQPNAAYAQAIYPKSCNTLRILTLWDIDRDRPYLAACAHRFGRRGCGSLDNFHGGFGGLCSPVDDEGCLGPALTLEAGRRVTYTHHPDTGSPIAGVRLPGWSRLGEELLELAARLSGAPFLGWDLVAQEDGWACIEVNPNPAVKVWQVHGGLLQDPRSRRFFQHHGVVAGPR